MEEQGRRRETSRHRSASRFTIPRPEGRAATVLVPLVSLLPPIVALVLVQSLSPAAQRVPTGAARFDLAGAWLATEPGALAGTTSWFVAPTLGRLQLGVLLHALQGGGAQSVLAAAHGAVLLLAVAQAGLLWWVLRRLGAGGVAAGLATAAFGIAPVAVVAHTAISATAFAVVWGLLAAGLAMGRGPGSRLAGGAFGALAVASAPGVAAVVVAIGVLLVLRWRGREAGRGWSHPAVEVGGGFVAAAAVLALAMAITAALPATAAAARLDALTAAQGTGPTGGGAAFVLWWQADPFGAVVAVGAVLLTALVVRDRAVTALVLVAAAVAVWPEGGDAVAPLLVLLPLVAVAVARSVDVGIAALGHPLFVRSVLGSGWLMGVGALLVVSVTVWVLGLGTLVSGRKQPVAEVERWVASSVPAGQTVLVGLALYPDLVGTTRADVQWYGGAAGGGTVPSSVPWTRADYVVVDASLPERPSGAAATVLGRSLAVARFGSGPAAMTVRAVRPTTGSAAPAPPTTAAGRAAAAARATIGRQLAANPRVEVTGQDRSLLLAGDVDARIAIVLAQFVTAHSVTVSGFGTAKGDTSGVRNTVTVSAIDGRPVPADGTKTGVLLRFLSNLRGDYATRSIDATDSGITAAFAPRPDFTPNA